LMVIIYYPGKDNCNSYSSILPFNMYVHERNKENNFNVLDNNYLRKLNKISNNTHFWVYKNDNDKYLQHFTSKKTNWQVDIHQAVEKLFFKEHYPCFSFVV